MWRAIVPILLFAAAIVGGLYAVNQQRQQTADHQHATQTAIAQGATSTAVVVAANLHTAQTATEAPRVTGTAITTMRVAMVAAHATILHHAFATRTAVAGVDATQTAVAVNTQVAVATATALAALAASDLSTQVALDTLAQQTPTPGPATDTPVLDTPVVAIPVGDTPVPNTSSAGDTYDLAQYPDIADHPDAVLGNKVRFSCVILKFFGDDPAVAGNQEFGCAFYSNGAYGGGVGDGEVIVSVSPQTTFPQDYPDYDSLHTGDDMGIWGTMDSPFDGVNSYGASNTWPRIIADSLTDTGTYQDGTG